MTDAVLDYADRDALLADIDTLLLIALDDILLDIPDDRLAEYLEGNPGVKLLVAIAGKLMKFT